MFKKSTLLAGLLFSCLGSFGQTFTGEKASALYKQAEMVRLDPENHRLQYLQLKAGSNVTVAAFPVWLRETLKQTNTSAWQQTTTFTDQQGQQHIRFQQYYNNIPVAGQVFIAHVRNGEVISCNGEYQSLTGMPQVNLNKAAAFRQALQLVVATNYMWQDPSEEQMLKLITGNSAATYYPQAELVYAPANGNFDTDDFVPAYKLDIYASAPMERSNVYLSATNGQLLFKENLLQDANFPGSAVTKYSGTKNIFTKKINGLYRLDEDTMGVRVHTVNSQRNTNRGSAVEFTDADNIWNNKNPFKDEVATDAHWGAEVTYKYYKDRFSRLSYNNQNGMLWSFVHFDQGYNNAFWNGYCMTYGDGDGSFMAPLTALDIVGHELTHGVTGNSAQLVYLNQSGALNESFSDIFGTAIDFLNNPTQANYLIGENVVYGGGALRDMQNPNAYGDPDTYGGLNWKAANGPDNGGVHSNSGVQNFWFYLLVNGGQGVNDLGVSYNLTGIGLTKAENIAYRSLTTYLTNSSNYADAAFYAVRAAEDLYGTCSVEAKATANAWFAVGLGTPYGLKADFQADNEYYCTYPATVNFTNKSYNANSYVWNFGDPASGVFNTSTLQNPTHVYSAQGTYTVKMKAVANTPVCGIAADSVIKTTYITVRNGVTTVSACMPPATATPQAGVGIKKVTFNTITKTSNDATEGNKDFSCNQVTNLVAGNLYDLTLETGTLPERAKAWIDYNNDGVFDVITEEATNFNPFVNAAVSVVRTSPTAVLNTPLRMRVAADYISNSNLTPCGALQKGQFEDYSVQFTAQTAAPVANFRASSNYLNAGGITNFTDLSNFQPTSWNWYFPGGNPSTSTAQNPTGITYPNDGIFPVRLIVHNALGTDTIVKAAYMHVGNVSGTKEAFAELNKFTVYPNPASEKVTIQYAFDGKKSLTISLVNMLGQEVMHRTTTAASQLETQLDVRNTAAGIYILRISDGTATATRKLILQKQ